MQQKQEERLTSPLATVVVGAGPAGLLFSFINRIRLQQKKIPFASWPLLLLEKRSQYVRNHRLLLDKSEYQKIQKQLNSKTFDEFIEYLEAVNFKPVINELEIFLMKALNEFGIEQIHCDVGNSEGQTSIQELKSILPPSFSSEKKAWTLVAADSVRGNLSELLGNDQARINGTHEYLVRLKFSGDHLPKSISFAENYRLAKVLSSVLSYRFNKNGFAEMDLFLSPTEFKKVSHLNANPKNPIDINKDLLKELKAPFFQQVILSFIQYNSEGSQNQVQLLSSFKLEHSINKSRIRYLENLNCIGFLLGDAAISLPFQRGMSAMIKCAHQLSEVHLSIFEQVQKKELKSITDLKSKADEYQLQTEKIAKKEIQIVASRASLVKGLRQFIRISAMLPFPIQSWLLGHEGKFSGKQLNATQFFLNLLIAISSSLSLYLAYFIQLGQQETWSSTPLSLIAFLLQFAGGFVYRANFTFPNRAHPWIKRIWQIQILAWMLFGITVMLYQSIAAGKLMGVGFATAWWVGGVFFAMGLLLFDQLGKYWFKKGRL